MTGFKNIQSQMFDIRPVTQEGLIDMEKINQVTAVLDLRQKHKLDLGEKKIPSVRLAINSDQASLSAFAPKIQFKQPFERKIKKPHLDKPIHQILEDIKEHSNSPTKPEIQPDESLLFGPGQPPAESVLPPEEFIPTKEDILNELEKIDQEEANLLKNTTLAKAIVPVQSIIAEQKPKTVPDNFDLSFETLSEKVHQNLTLGNGFYYQPALRPRALRQKPSFIFQPSWLIGTITLFLVAIGFFAFGQKYFDHSSYFGSARADLNQIINDLQINESPKALEDNQENHLVLVNLNQIARILVQTNQSFAQALSAISDEQDQATANQLTALGQELTVASQSLNLLIDQQANLNWTALMNDAGTLTLTGFDLTNLIAEQSKTLMTVSSNLEKASQLIRDYHWLGQWQTAVGAVAKILPNLTVQISKEIQTMESYNQLLGYQSPKKYLMLFQNTSEKRATGGFIGTYGILTLDKGEASDLMVEGVMNADAQIRVKIIPPRPLQKISTAWSLHDSNWFADFSLSAEKAIYFLDQTDAPKVDGVISLTPEVIKKILDLTGPIEMRDYQVVFDASNFLEKMQYEVEVDFDRQLNQPKKILSDFTPKLIAAVKKLSSIKKIQASLIIFEALKQKDIMLFSKDSKLQEFILDQGWAGELKSADFDYLSVVSSNVGGEKTDQVIQQEIEHQVNVQPDGSIIDSVKVTKKHLGGKTGYTWYDHQNVDYLRLYVPFGSQLINVSGQGAENYTAPIDYQAEGFSADPLVKSLEADLVTETSSGTDVYQESNKTVFGHWFYVKPGKTTQIIFQYRLPNQMKLTNSRNSYKLLIQKQAGSQNVKYSHKIGLPEKWLSSTANATDWLQPQDLKYDLNLSYTISK